MRKAITKRIKFTESEPTFFPADSNDILVMVQKKAVSKAANSPIYCVMPKIEE